MVFIKGYREPMWCKFSVMSFNNKIKSTYLAKIHSYSHRWWPGVWTTISRLRHWTSRDQRKTPVNINEYSCISFWTYPCMWFFYFYFSECQLPLKAWCAPANAKNCGVVKYCKKNNNQIQKKWPGKVLYQLRSIFGLYLGLYIQF